MPPPHPPPRFAVGETVMVRSAIDPTRNLDRTRVLERQWFDGETDRGRYRGWQYVVAPHTDAWAMERSLRPRPRPAGLSWPALRERLRARRQPSCPSSSLSKP